LNALGSNECASTSRAIRLAVERVGLAALVGVLRIASLPSRLFLREGFMLPCIVKAHSLIGMTELKPALADESITSLWRFCITVMTDLLPGPCK
jgi:hypothetical protein